MPEFQGFITSLEANFVAELMKKIPSGRCGDF